jgi:aspartyl-tRNA(Asn)/glutamyl-tRNA(Gln) amidotransferase subunit A
VGARLRDGDVSPVELTERSLERIEARDPELNAFQLVLAEQALAEARQAETEIASGRYRGPLHGVPVAAKDLLTMEGTVTTAGSKVLAENVTDFDAAGVERLRAAGAIIVGKTRLSEFAYWPGSTNPHYGPTKNPHDVTRDTGGSSSGSGAAVADGIVYAALGSDTGGSIRIPATLCGVVGLKPTFGRVSLFGCAPLAWSLDHLGPLTRSVEDAALMLSVLAGPDARDTRTRLGSEFALDDESNRGARGLRVGVITTDGSPDGLGSEAVLPQWEASNRALVDAGATLVEVDLPEMAALWHASFLTLGVEATTLHAPWLRASYSDYGEFCGSRLLAAFAYSAQDFVQAQRLTRIVRQKWDAVFEKIDVLSTPSQPDVAPPLGVGASTRFTNPFNALGWPAISVPYGSDPDGLPTATQLVAKPWDEATLFRAALALEMSTG